MLHISQTVACCTLFPRKSLQTIKMIKLPIPPLLITAYTAKTTKKKKTTDERRALHKELNRARDRTRVNIGVAFSRWRELRKQRRIKSDADLATFLLDRYEASASHIKSTTTQRRREDDFAIDHLDFNQEGERISSMEIVVDIDEDNLSHTDSESNGAIKTKRCLNAVQSSSTEEAVHDVEDSETVEQSPTEEKTQKNSPQYQLGNQENDPAGNFHQDQGRFEKTSSAERPSGNSGTTSLLPSSKSLLTSPPVQSLMSTEAHLDKAGPEVNQQDQFQGENKQETQNQDQGSALTGGTLRSPEPTSKHGSCYCNPQKKQPEETKQNQQLHKSRSDYVCLTCRRVFSQSQSLKRQFFIRSGNATYVGKGSHRVETRKLT